jgi:hypothetical protein
VDEHVVRGEVLFSDEACQDVRREEGGGRREEGGGRREEGGGRREEGGGRWALAGGLWGGQGPTSNSGNIFKNYGNTSDRHSRSVLAEPRTNGQHANLKMDSDAESFRSCFGHHVEEIVFGGVHSELAGIVERAV